MARAPYRPDNEDIHAIIDEAVKKALVAFRPEMDAALEKNGTAILEKLGIGADFKARQEWQEIIAWARNRREIENALVKQGLGVVIAALIGGIITAIIVWIRSGAPK